MENPKKLFITTGFDIENFEFLVSWFYCISFANNCNKTCHTIHHSQSHHLHSAQAQLYNFLQDMSIGGCFLIFNF